MAELTAYLNPLIIDALAFFHSSVAAAIEAGISRKPLSVLMLRVQYHC